MPRTIQVHQIDAFTRIKFTGNPAGVVLEADPLSDAEMLAIARELNNADTAFILKADGPDHDLRVRFFTPRTEAAFVGHASVAAHYVLSAAATHGARRVRQRSRAGWSRWKFAAAMRSAVSPYVKARRRWVGKSMIANVWL